MTTTRERIITSTEPVFDAHGFAGIGVDRLTEAAGVSSRTLYKHMGSKTGLIAAVLDARRDRFSRVFAVSTVDELFDALASWVRSEGARGCLFLRALGEDGHGVAEVEHAVAEYRELLHRVMASIVERETGGADELLAEQLLVVFEGATSAASYRGQRAVDAARAAARSLVVART
ncbi:transcriptional regulator, TetR family [Prauserella aidingensis]|uniref:TetR/AcrR family transcriptional regulator n=1 Tax=Prauserella aidingensis TaxID=387890 RepID=UPI0020A28A30|nr:TetR/AcrR family transcriptional regulator [Prauserella aidingensis]MCP2251562.1 transcriptional regulator, TetR family [Prauserella aidingensis]